MTAPDRKEDASLSATNEEAIKFMDSFLKEFPIPLGPEAPLPVKPLNNTVSREEVHGESLELALRLLQDRNLPHRLSAALCHEAAAALLQSDLRSFQNQQESQEEETLLDSVPLLCSLINTLRDVCCVWQKHPPYFETETRVLQTSVHAIKNTRRKMEDRHVIVTEFNQLFGIQDQINRSYFAVFDGHGGLDAATYAATHIHVKVAESELLQSKAGEALQIAFKKTDEMFLLKAKRQRLRSGATGVAALICDDMLHVAWLGDSQVVLVRKGQVVTLMDPHKPEREDERERIEALGGCVAFMGCWRVNGTIAVSRAIGDIDQKPYISGDADRASFQLTGTEDYLLLACDGFFDTVKPYDIVSVVLDYLRENQGDGSKVAEKLVTEAKVNGSSDNITVLVVFLKDPKVILQEAGELEESSSAPFIFFRDVAENQNNTLSA
ncbi:PPM1F phosphatase, partial [Polypterus senegalus]|nr:protein phosphatase 1F [Polypterus senegalus]MBN3289245.1 PPM1F phosphatase [Polypterus senegalus]